MSATDQLSERLDIMEALSSEFSRLCTVEGFKEIWPHYTFSCEQQDLFRREFSRLKDITYLDHAGTTLYAESQVRAFYEDISRNVYGNPHSHNSSSEMTHDTVERVRYRILEHFNTSPEEYSVIFTSGCTAALKLVAESFPWTSASDTFSGSQFCYLTDNHTSVVGIRGVTEPQGVRTLPVLPQEVEARAKETQVMHPINAQEECFVAHLFCYPAQSNFSGRKYPMSYVRGIQCQQLYPACEHRGQWFVLLDASSFIGCSPLDLKQYPADFVPISFYKTFGFPTGLGALLVRNEVAELLKKKYFGGGTASAYLVGEDYFVAKSDIVRRFEDGTISFLDIVSLHHGFDALHRLTGSMQNIQCHTFGLARYTYAILSCLCHSNAQPVAQIYCDSEFDNATEQGAILNFNLLDCYGQVIGYYQVDKMASLFNIHLRTGCFCNTGACQAYLGISNDEVKSNLEAGHVCGDNIDLIDGRPTGSIRISFGYMSTFEDCQCFLKFIVNCFVEKPLQLNQKRLAKLTSTGVAKSLAPQELPLLTIERPEPLTNGLNISPASSCKLLSQDTKTDWNSKNAYTLTNIFIYPIKSCAAFEVTKWPVGPQGLLYDRMWMVVNEKGVYLSQKREPKLCLIHPHICLTSNTLLLEAQGMDPITISLEIGKDKHGPRTCQNKVCGDRVQTIDSGEEVAIWLSEFLGKPCRLIRQSPSFVRNMKIGTGKGACPPSLSLANEAQFLLINRASVALLLSHISNRQDSSNNCTTLDMLQLISRFRANLVITGLEPFEEEDWTSITIRDTRFQVAGKCTRCQMIGIDQNSGTKSQEPLRSLSDCRSGKITFGIYLNHLLQRTNPYSTLSVESHVMPCDTTNS